MIIKAIGLMSGTSMDGIDAALIETDGKDYVKSLAHFHLPYDDSMRAALRICITYAQSIAAPRPDIEPFSGLSRRLTLLHVEAVKSLVSISGQKADIIGFHGQTLVHRPDQHWTWQIGDGAMLASVCQIPVVNDFRTADVTAGGQGAPLVPIYHAALAAQLTKPIALVNIGGVANITYIGENARLLAFDTGPGNALIDDWMQINSNAKWDEGGITAAAGSVHEDILSGLLDNPWFDVTPPKSLDRNDFGVQSLRGLNLADGAATLTAFTAEAIKLSLDHLPDLPKHWLVCGGGRHNATLMMMLKSKLRTAVDPIDVLGWDGDFIEAEAFAYLAVCSLNGVPLSFPGTTGVPTPKTGGVLWQP